MTCNSHKTIMRPIGAPSSHKIIGISLSQFRPWENTDLVVKFLSAWCGSIAWNFRQLVYGIVRSPWRSTYRSFNHGERLATANFYSSQARNMSAG